MQLDLIAHPATPPSDPDIKLWANVDYAGLFGASATLNVWFGVDAPIGHFAISQSEDPGRRDELWTSTCFEAFLQVKGETAYQEWNFAPSGDWAAYDFDDRRTGMREQPVEEPPYIRVEDNLTWWALGATIAIPSGRPWTLGLSAVIEESDGTKSYWALQHCSDKPDFHDPACFTARLA